MTEIEKAKLYFKQRGVFAYTDEGSLYIITPDSNSFNIMVSASEISYRASLYDESIK